MKVFEKEFTEKILLDTLTEKDTETKLLKESLTLMRTKKFGPSSEKVSDGQFSIDFFDEAEKALNPHVSEPTMEKVTTRKKKTSRKEKIQELETEVVSYEIQAEAAICPECRTPLKKIHEVSREAIKMVKSFIRLMEKRSVYAFPNFETITKAPMPYYRMKVISHLLQI